MFGSQILEVGIGLILVFLLVSLILTAVRETIESVMKSRSRDLERALAELLNDHGRDGLRAELYNHPLISGLFKGAPALSNFNASSFPQSVSALWARLNTKEAAATTESTNSPDTATPNPSREKSLPSYIPRETFAIALFDLLKQKYPTVTATSLTESRPTDRIEQAYALIHQIAGGEPDEIRKQLEQWYDAAMDRAAGWYRRRTQRILFFLGVLVALLLNVNAYTIGQYLATDEVARQQVGQVSTQLLADKDFAAALRQSASSATPSAEKTAKETQPSPGSPNATSNGVAGADAMGAANAKAPSADGNAPSPPAAGTSRTGQAKPAATPDKVLQAQLDRAGLPIGWKPGQIGAMWAQAKDQGFWKGLFYLLPLLAGWIAVGFAATLGAPFWFDLLDKFMVIRSTVKPTEKSPDEASKNSNRGRGGPATDEGNPKPGK